MVNESIIVGLVIGGGVAVIGALIGHFLRLREMNQQSDREKHRMEAYCLPGGVVLEHDGGDMAALCPEPGGIDEHPGIP